MENIFEKQYTIEYYDVDKKESASFISIIEYMLETASIQSEVYDFGMDYLGNKGECWILLEARSKIIKLPKLGEKITIKTWVKSSKKLFILRQYEILNEKGEVLCVGTSKWIIYSIEMKMPIRIDGEINDKYRYCDKSVIDDDFVKIKDTNNYNKIITKEVMYRDIDTNWHMNNIKYLKHIVESMDNDFLKNHIVEEYSVIYKHELKYSQKFDICINKINDFEYMYYIKQKGEDIKQNNCEAYIKWKKN